MENTAQSSKDGNRQAELEEIDHTNEQCNCENPVLDSVEEVGKEHVFCIACA